MPMIKANPVHGAMISQGTWNANTNSPTMPAASALNKGWFYRVSTAGTTTVDGISSWAVNDIILSDGSAWRKIDNTAGVSQSALDSAVSDVNDSIDNLTTVVDGKANTSHTHAISDVTSLQTALDGKSATNHTHDSLTDGTSTITVLQALDTYNSVLSDTSVVTGCVAAWSGSGLTYNVSAGIFRIRGVRYIFPGGSVTLGTADATNDRFDVIVLNADLSVTAVEGTPAANPSDPPIDEDTQLKRLSVLVQANATTPGNVSLVSIYADNTGSDGWTPTATSNVNASSTNNPYGGTGKCIEFTSATSNNGITLDKGSTYDPSNASILNLFIRSKGSWSNRRLNIQWLNASGTALGKAYSLGDGIAGFVSSYTAGYQQVTIAMSSFQLKSTDVVRKLKLTVGGSGSNLIGLYLDAISTQQGVALTASQNVVQTFNSDSGSYTAQGPTDQMGIVGTNGISTSVSGNVLTVTTNGATAATNNTLVKRTSTGGIAATSGSFTKAVNGGVFELTDASTVTVDATQSNHMYLLMTDAVGASRTLGNPTGGVHGQKVTFEIVQSDSGNQELLLGSKFVKSAEEPAISWSVEPNSTDIMHAIYNANIDRWRVLPVVHYPATP